MKTRRCTILLSSLLAASGAMAQTLADAVDACESFVVTGTIPDTVDTEFTLMGDLDYGAMQTEVGPVLMTFAKGDGENATAACDMTGTDPRDDSAPIHVSWASALPLIDTWFTARAARGGGTALPVLGAQRMFAVCSDAAEYFISAQPYLSGPRTATLAMDDWPLVVRIIEWTGTAARPCDF